MKRILNWLPWLVLGAFLWLLAGCDDPAEITRTDQENQKSLRSPEPVGNLVDGRRVVRMKVNNPDDTRFPHWIYLIESNSTVTLNTLHPYGKSVGPQVLVIIDGKVYHLPMTSNSTVKLELEQ